MPGNLRRRPYELPQRPAPRSQGCEVARVLMGLDTATGNKFPDAIAGELEAVLGGKSRATLSRKSASRKISAARWVNIMVKQINCPGGVGTDFANGVSRCTRNDVQFTANRQRAGGPLHRKRLTSHADVAQSCASMTQEKI